ncbi:MAG: zinc ribbon domain-containing protein [Clostridia bacterium]|nr:zinc ribbon domain-containing protein [Clostridia bacterium]
MDVGKLLVFLFVAGVIIAGLVIYLRNHQGNFKRPEIKDDKNGSPFMMSTKEAMFLNETKLQLSGQSADGSSAGGAHTPAKGIRTVKCPDCGATVEVNDEKVCDTCGASVAQQIAELVKSEQALKIMMMQMDAQRAIKEERKGTQSEVTDTLKKTALNLMLPGAGSLVGRKKRK